MRRKLTITIDEEVYEALHRVAGKRHVSQFIEKLARPHVIFDKNIEASYREMSQDLEREKEASEWSDGLIGDVCC